MGQQQGPRRRAGRFGLEEDTACAHAGAFSERIVVDRPEVVKVFGCRIGPYGVSFSWGLYDLWGNAQAVKRASERASGRAGADTTVPFGHTFLVFLWVREGAVVLVHSHDGSGQYSRIQHT